jgi:two-component sensor histidine kinase
MSGDGNRSDVLLREALVREDRLQHQISELVEQHEVSIKESDHRTANCLQLIAGVLWLQSRASPNAENAAQLAAAAERVIVVGHLHHHLHRADGVETVAFKQYLEDLCCAWREMLSSDDLPGRVIVMEGIELQLSAVASISLGFVVNELITNAAKYGQGSITLRLEADPERGYALSVSNDGLPLPKDFDGAAGKRLGMKIICAFVDRVGGELRIGRNDDNQGARFTVLFGEMSGIGHN